MLRSPRIVPRKGLLRDNLSEGELEDMIWGDRRVFIEAEERLVQEGHKGKFALFYEGKLWKIMDDKVELARLFYDSVGNKPCYIDRVGGDV